MSRRTREVTPSEETVKAGGRSKLASFFEMPEAAMGSISHIEISGNTEAIVDGCQGVLQYDENVIKLNTAKMVVKFTGKRLQIKCMTNENAIISGYITGVEFLIN